MKPQHQQVAADAIRHAMEPLHILLNEALGYIIAEEYLAALGTLVFFDESARDVSAAIRVFRAALRRNS